MNPSSQAGPSWVQVSAPAPGQVRSLRQRPPDQLVRAAGASYEARGAAEPGDGGREGWGHGEDMGFGWLKMVQAMDKLWPGYLGWCAHGEAMGFDGE